ncbi:unnamed protein product, partial [Rotaria magnacalcarata]
REFAAAVTRGKNELKLADASITPVTHFIENAVIELMFNLCIRLTVKSMLSIYILKNISFDLQ